MLHQTIAVFGGTGFVGRHLIGRLAAQGRKVKVFTRRRERHRALLVLPGVSLVEGDIYDEAFLRRALYDCDAVINLVGILNEKGDDGAGFRHAHVALPRRITNACSALGIERLLHMSALNADPVNGTSHYLRSKGEGESLVHKAEGLKVTSFRPSVIFGADDSFFNRFAALLRMTPLLFPLACPNARFAPVYVGDLVELMAQSLDDPESFGQRYDICGPYSYTLYQLVRYTARQVGVRRLIVPLGDTLSRLQAFTLQWLPGKPFSMDNYRSLQRDSICGAGFPSHFGIEPTPLEAVVPCFLRGECSRAHYDHYRAQARRERPEAGV